MRELSEPYLVLMYDHITLLKLLKLDQLLDPYMNREELPLRCSLEGGPHNVVCNLYICD